MHVLVCRGTSKHRSSKKDLFEIIRLSYGGVNYVDKIQNSYPINFITSTIQFRDFFRKIAKGGQKRFLTARGGTQVSS